MSSHKRKAQIEFGDFQTPRALAARVCKVLAGRGVNPASIVEPTCGEGTFLIAAIEEFPEARSALGLEINPLYAARAESALSGREGGVSVSILRGDFFTADWRLVLAPLPDPLLVIGNPPWVTNAGLGVLGSSNLPNKSNFQGHAGLAAMTGKSNFDISEWMLIKLLDLLKGRCATLAMLCKTAVARKVLSHLWRNDVELADSTIYEIDAAAAFDVNVHACLLVCSLGEAPRSSDCAVYAGLDSREPAATIGFRCGRLVSDVCRFARLQHLRGKEVYRWRSGVKHDCGKVMELREEGTRYRNGLGELVDLESEYLYPLLKSSDVAAGRDAVPRRWMLVTQTRIGEDTSRIGERAPKTWSYLVSHGKHLDKRASSIYRRQPRFAVFGVGGYSFAPWKVAISGLHKALRFAPVGAHKGKPIVLDDTCYFVPCQSKAEAEFVADLLNSQPANDFLEASIFWDAKRPITVDVLRELDLRKLARELGCEQRLNDFASPVSAAEERTDSQLVLFDAK